jgi:hypothetical protein
MIAPILFSISFVLILFNHNTGELTLQSALLPLFAVTFFALIISVIFIAILGNRLKGVIFASIFVIMFFSYGNVLAAVANQKLSNHVLFPIWIALLLLFFLLVRRMSKHLSMVKGYLTLVAVIAAFMPFIAMVRYELSRKTQPRPESFSTLSNVDVSDLDKKNLPDIYYIITDSYSSGNNLQKYFNYDDSPFITFLKNKGFYVADQSTSNYPKTFLSLASSLNMEYLDYLSIYKNSNDQTITDRIIEDNNVVRFLKSLGYHYYQMGSWWGSTHYSRLADDNFIIEKKSLGDIGEFNYMILDSSMLHPFISTIFSKVIVGESDEDKRARVLYQFAQLPNVAKLPGPKFVFVHIISPHGPYVFGKNCENVSYDQIWMNKEGDNYVNQINCIDQKFEGAINAVIKNSAKPPVILLQSDEGPNFINGGLTPADNWSKASIDQLQEKFPILSAYYFPAVSDFTLYSTITPVNSFRVVFNLYFSTKLPLLPDKNYVFLDSEHLYDFKDVTSALATKTTD